MNTALAQEVKVIESVNKLEYYLQKLGLKREHSLTQFQAKVKAYNKNQLILAWNEHLHKFKEENGYQSISDARRDLSENMKEYMGWNTSNNLLSYINPDNDKVPGESVMKKMASFFEIEVSSISICFENEVLIEHENTLSEKQKSISDNKKLVVSSNLTERWISFRNDTSFTQEQFCKMYLPGTKQSQFSNMLNGRISLTNDILLKLSDVFGCFPSDIDPDFDDKKTDVIKGLLKIINSKDLDEKEEEYVQTVRTMLRSA